MVWGYKYDSDHRQIPSHGLVRFVSMVSAFGTTVNSSQHARTSNAAHLLVDLPCSHDFQSSCLFTNTFTVLMNVYLKRIWTEVILA
jgi:hypothetical protein